jgi:L-Ala-D/L-Glu epimerase
VSFVIISALYVREIQLPLRETFRTAIRQTDAIDAIEIELVNSAGISFVGYSTATPMITGDTVRSIFDHVERVGRAAVLGASVDTATQVDQLIEENQTSRKVSSSAVAGLDQALRLLRTNRAGLNSDSAMGRIPKAGEYRVQTSVTLSAASTADMLASAQRRLDLGFLVVKAKLGREPETDADRLIALSRFLEGRATFWVDANQGWTRDQTMMIIESADSADALPAMLEQPVQAADIEVLCELSARLPIPVVADESARFLEDIDRIAMSGGVAAINVKFMKFGGWTGAAVAVDRSRQHGMGALVGSMMEHPASVAEAIAFASMLPESVHDLDAAWWSLDPSPVRYEDGQAIAATKSAHI